MSNTKIFLSMTISEGVTSILDEYAKKRSDFLLNLGIKVGAGMFLTLLENSINHICRCYGWISYGVGCKKNDTFAN